MITFSSLNIPLRITRCTLLFTLLIHSFPQFAQLQAVDVAELTLKVGAFATEELYYGFAEGDELLFSFEEVNGRDVKEIEILEIPGHSKFMDYKSSLIKNKKLTINQKGIYQFRFYNSGLKSRICKISIQRIPKTADLIDFNTQWEWKTIYDTTYIPYIKDSLTGYTVNSVRKSRKELVDIDTIPIEVLNRSERVHSQTAIDKPPYSLIQFQLPQNSYSPHAFAPYESTEVIAWAYWLGVGQKSKEDYQRANANLAKGIGGIMTLSGYGALASLAITGVSVLANSNVGENVQYQFSTLGQSGQQVFDKGNVSASSARNTRLLQGNFQLYLYNDNFRDGIDVEVRVVAVMLKKTWKDIEYMVEEKEPQYVQLNKVRMEVKASKIRVNKD